MTKHSDAFSPAVPADLADPDDFADHAAPVADASAPVAEAPASRRDRDRFGHWARQRAQRVHGQWRIAQLLELELGLPMPVPLRAWVAVRDQPAVAEALARATARADLEALAVAIDAVDAREERARLEEAAAPLVARARALTTDARELRLLARAWSRAADLPRTLEQLRGWLARGHEDWAAGVDERARIRALSAELHLSGYPELFSTARSLGRRFRVVVGPPNSGKTHGAMDRLARADSGCYLAPLRLLALEGQEALAARGVEASLVTGEERELIEGSRHVAATVEMLDMERVVDVAVIDEFQMLFDRDRGWAWTQAIVAAPAREVILVGAAYALPMLERLLATLGEPYEIERFERKAPLELDREQVVPLSRLRAGDALIAFSRRDVLRYKDELERHGRRVAVIYGALSPEVRRREAERFRSGDAQILVATDAIGMGLNLPIARVVFSTITKWDGLDERLLEPAEFHQIAGRAGRFGMHERGRVALLVGARPGWSALETLFLTPPAAPAVTRLSVAPAWTHVLRIASALASDDLATVLAVFTERLQLSDALFEPAPLSDMRALAADVVPATGIALRERFTYAQAPASERPEALRLALAWWAGAHARGEFARLDALPARFEGRPQSTEGLADAETRLKLAALYAWLAWRFPQAYPDAPRAHRQLAQLDAYIERALALGAQREREGRSERRGERGPGRGRGQGARRPRPAMR